MCEIRLANRLGGRTAPADTQTSGMIIIIIIIVPEKLAEFAAGKNVDTTQSGFPDRATVFDAFTRNTIFHGVSVLRWHLVYGCEETNKAHRSVTKLAQFPGNVTCLSTKHACIASPTSAPVAGQR